MTHSFMKCAFRFFFAALVVLAIAVIAAPQLAAQSLISGDIAGTVTDPTGAVVANAQLTLLSLDRGETQTTTTNASGYYRFSLLKPGQYSITLSHTGFRRAESKTAVAVGQVATMNFTLALGQTSETVEVNASAAVVNTETSGVATTYDQRLVQDTPNPGGDLTYIAQTAPGATMNTAADMATSASMAARHLELVHGQRRERHGSVPEPEQLGRNQPDAGDE